MSLISLTNIHVRIEDAEVVKGVSLDIAEGEVHAIMGPNGSGKSSLVNALMGHPSYEITEGSITFDGEDLLAMDAHERALAGLFLAFQYPKEIAGVTLRSFLHAAHKAQMEARDPDAKLVSPIKFDALLREKLEMLHMDPELAERPINQGFSGGEKKKAEVLQLSLLQPRLALLDETDSGLDVDALQIVAEGVNTLRSPNFSALIVTHYARILEYIIPDKVHVMVNGNIVESGGSDLAYQLEKEGYKQYQA